MNPHGLADDNVHSVQNLHSGEVKKEILLDDGKGEVDGKDLEKNNLKLGRILRNLSNDEPTFTLYNLEPGTRYIHYINLKVTLLNTLSFLNLFILYTI